MENKNLHTNNDTFLAQWLEGELSYRIKKPYQ